MGNGIRNYYFGVLETDRVRSVDERVVSERFLYAQQSNLNLTETDCGKALFIHGHQSSRSSQPYSNIGA